MRSIILSIFSATVLLVSTISVAENNSGLIILDSDFSVSKTLDRLGMALERKGVTVFARINHKDGAEKSGLELKPTSLLIFGTPKMGTPLMQSNPQIGIDLPLKALAWTDEAGQTKLAYTDPTYLMERHKFTDKNKIFEKMAGALKKFTHMATTKGALPQ